MKSHKMKMKHDMDEEFEEEEIEGMLRGIIFYLLNLIYK